MAESRSRGSGRTFLVLAFGPPALSLAILAISEACTDRFAALQFLWWIPRVALAVLMLAWLLAAFALASALGRGARDLRRLGAALVIVVAVGAIVLSRDWGLPAGRPADAFRLAHWNGNWVRDEVARAAVDALLAVDADAIVITDPGELFFDAGDRRMQEAGYRIVPVGRFALCTRVPVVEARPLIASRQRSVSRLRLLTRTGTLVIEVVDLPSAASLPRWEIVRTLAADLATLRPDAPDVFIGDFNITRGSASLRLLAPDHRDSFIESGTGWGGTFRRERPFLAIDLTLVGPRWRSLRSEVVDFGFGRHRAQVTDLVREDRDAPDDPR